MAVGERWEQAPGLVGRATGGPVPSGYLSSKVEAPNEFLAFCHRLSQEGRINLKHEQLISFAKAPFHTSCNPQLRYPLSSTSPCAIPSTVCDGTKSKRRPAIVLARFNPQASPQKLTFKRFEEEDEVQRMESCNIFHFYIPSNWIQFNPNDCVTE